ncbi:MAG TPA: hypothetical protein VJU83_02990 [Burkholderiales bacterium]|nr:hypothetical protein [Burkholderiales bacterium]
MKTPLCLLQPRLETMIHVGQYTLVRLFVLVSLLLTVALWPPHLAAANKQGRVLDANPDNYRAMLRQLEPGDTLRLAEGEYRNGLPIHRRQGEPGRPLTIEGPAPPAKAIFVGRPGANTVSFIDAAYIVLRQLEIDGRGLPVDGIKAEGHANWTHHIVLEDLRIVGHGHDQQTVAISTKCPSWEWVVRRVTFIEPGTGMYFGNSNGAAPFVAGLIEENVVINPRGYAMQIKHQHRRPSLDNLPTTPQQTLIRTNHFIKTSGSSEGPLARPSVLIGHAPLEGAGSNDLYLIYNNLFYDNPTEALFQGEGNLALYNNLFINPHGPALRIQPHNHRPRSVQVFHNTVLSAGTGIEVSGVDAGYTPTIVANAVFAARPSAGDAPMLENFFADVDAADAELRQASGDLEILDLRPRVGRLLLGGRLPSALMKFPGAETDFLDRPRQLRAYGAYDGR